MEAPTHRSSAPCCRGYDARRDRRDLGPVARLSTGRNQFGPRATVPAVTSTLVRGEPEAGQTPPSLTSRLFAASAHWDGHRNQWIFEDGWERDFHGESMGSYRTYTIEAVPQIHEPPQYFKKEFRQSSEMSFGELQRYIHDLRQSGFDTMRLRVQLNHKLAYPLVTFVMAMLAIPFSLSMGRRGSLAGIAAAIGLAIAYWVVAGMFEAMGNVNMLPAFLAAWSPDLLFGLTGGYLLLRTPT